MAILEVFEKAKRHRKAAEQKKALFRRVMELLGENPVIRPQDLFVNIVEVAKENWSLGNGVAQYA